MTEVFNARVRTFHISRSEDHFKYQKVIGELNTFKTDVLDANRALEVELYQRGLLEARIRQMRAEEANEATASRGFRKLRKSSKVTS